MKIWARSKWTPGIASHRKHARRGQTKSQVTSLQLAVSCDSGWSGLNVLRKATFSLWICSYNTELAWSGLKTYHSTFTEGSEVLQHVNNECTHQIYVYQLCKRKHKKIPNVLFSDINPCYHVLRKEWLVFPNIKPDTKLIKPRLDNLTDLENTAKRNVNRI